MNFFLGVSTNQEEPWKIVYICCQLHNICVDKKLPFFDDPEDAQIGGDDEDAVYQGPLNDGKTTRNHLIRQRFV